MLEVVDRLGAALLDASLAATAITGLVVLAMIQCRQPARRRDWARAGLLATLALLPLAALNPVPRIDLRGPLRDLLSTSLEAPPTSTPREDRLIWKSFPERPRPEDGFDDPGTATGQTGRLRQVARSLIVLYLLGFSIGLGGLGLGLWGSARLVRRGRIPSASSLLILRLLPFDGAWSTPRLLVSDQTSRPVLLGGLRPTILIPSELDGSDAVEALRLSLLHELAHAESLDHWFAPLAALARSFWFFLPPVRWISDQMKLDQEFLADRRAVDHFGTSGGYASSLVALASPIRLAGDPEASTRSQTVSSFQEGGLASSLFQRVMMLLSCPFAIEGRTPLWWRWSTAATIAGVTLAASCLTLRGLAGWSSSRPSASLQAARSFRLPHLAIGQREHDDQPFDLRFRLPDHFTMTFEVMAEPAELSEIEMLGHKLGEPRELDPGRSAYRLWHRVKIIRASGHEQVEVDGQSRPAGSGPSRPATWLTIQTPAGRTTRLRDLELIW